MLAKFTGINLVFNRFIDVYRVTTAFNNSSINEIMCFGSGELYTYCPTDKQEITTQIQLTTVIKSTLVKLTFVEAT